MSSTGLHDRLNSVVGNESFRSIGTKTHHNPETVRRYMKGQSPSVDFIAAFCSSYDVNESWLLTGHGPAKASDVRRHQLSQANPGELLAAVADALERLTDRVDRIETYIQTMETRLRGRDGAAAGAAGVDSPDAEGEDESREAANGATQTDSRVVSRAAAVADAVSKRAS